MPFYRPRRSTCGPYRCTSWDRITAPPWMRWPWPPTTTISPNSSRWARGLDGCHRPGARTERVLERYAAHRALVRSHGITLGRARLAFRAESCTSLRPVHDRLPLRLIYSSVAHVRQTPRPRSASPTGPAFSRLRLEEVGGAPSCVVRDVGTGRARMAVGRPDLRGLRRHRDDAPRARLLRPLDRRHAPSGVGAVRVPASRRNPVSDPRTLNAISR